MNEESKPQCVAVVGQGLLGRGIAACFLRHGFAVVTIDRHEEQLADARQSISQMMDELIERGDASPQVRHEWPQRFTATVILDGWN